MATYNAQLFEAAGYKIAGTLDGYLDFVSPRRGTKTLSLEEAVLLRNALTGAIDDVRANCLYDADDHLEKPIDRIKSTAELLYEMFLNNEDAPEWKDLDGSLKELWRKRAMAMAESLKAY